jgi:outer membrane protein assembly factor BamB
MKTSILLTLAALSSTLTAALPPKAAPGGDWPSYRGPNGDGTTAADFGKAWDTAGPKQVWKADTTNGFSSITVSGGIAATLVTRDHEGSPTEHAVAFDAASGKELWAQPLKLAKYDGGGDAGTGDNKGGDGPRSTPAISDGKVYIYGSNLDLYCFDAKSGKKLWDKDVPKEYGGKNIQWQNAISPLIEGGLVIVSGGGSGAAFIALDKATGTLKWKSEDDTITHATPTAATIHGDSSINSPSAPRLRPWCLKTSSIAPPATAWVPDHTKSRRRAASGRALNCGARRATMSPTTGAPPW